MTIQEQWNALSDAERDAIGREAVRRLNEARRTIGIKRELEARK